MNTRTLLSLLSGTALTLLLASCSSTPPAPQEPPAPEPTAYEKFILNTRAYPTTMEVYQDEELLKSATGKSPVFICLSQQRGRLYVNGDVAMDWPVSTGTYGHETPKGKFRIVEKEKDHSSNRYGHLYNAEGKCINSNVDIFEEEIPEGGKFVGSPMPNWMRLTSDGVGMHTGKVRAGKRLSHGCIRTPHAVAVRLFDLTKVGQPVTIADAPEAGYPGADEITTRAQKDVEEDQARKLAEEQAAKRAAEQKAREEARKNRKWFW